MEDVFRKLEKKQIQNMNSVKPLLLTRHHSWVRLLQAKACSRWKIISIVHLFINMRQTRMISYLSVIRKGELFLSFKFVHNSGKNMCDMVLAVS